MVFATCHEKQVLRVSEIEKDFMIDSDCKIYKKFQNKSICLWQLAFGGFAPMFRFLPRESRPIHLLLKILLFFR